MKGLIWLTWRQHRWPILISTALTVGLAVWMLITASRLGTRAAQLAGARPQGDLDKAASFASYQMNAIAFLPVLLAVFFGVPVLAREFEQRTLPLAWSQDVGRQRWLFGKTVILGTLVAALGTVLAGVAVHLAHQYHAYTGDSLFEGSAFQAGGWLPLTLALAWLAFGVAAGAAARRTMPAIAVVGAAWVLRMNLMPKLRQGFMKPLLMLKPIAGGDLPGAAPGVGGSTQDPAPTNDMQVDTHNAGFVDAQGTHYSGRDLDMMCAGPGAGSRSGMSACVSQHGIVAKTLQYQPASRMGTFHVIENGINLGLLIVSLAVAWWCVKRTRTTVV